MTYELSSKSMLRIFGRSSWDTHLGIGPENGYCNSRFLFGAKRLLIRIDHRALAAYSTNPPAGVSSRS